MKSDSEHPSAVRPRKWLLSQNNSSTGWSICTFSSELLLPNSDAQRWSPKYSKETLTWYQLIKYSYLGMSTSVSTATSRKKFYVPDFSVHHTKTLLPSARIYLLKKSGTCISSAIVSSYKMPPLKSLHPSTLPKSLFRPLAWPEIFFSWRKSAISTIYSKTEMLVNVIYPIAAMLRVTYWSIAMCQSYISKNGIYHVIILKIHATSQLSILVLLSLIGLVCWQELAKPKTNETYTTEESNYGQIQQFIRNLLVHTKITCSQMPKCRSPWVVPPSCFNNRRVGKT